MQDSYKSTGIYRTAGITAFQVRSSSECQRHVQSINVFSTELSRANSHQHPHDGSCKRGWILFLTVLAKPSSNLLQRTGGDHRGGRAQPGRRTFMTTCLCWILAVMDMSSCRPMGASVARLVLLVSGAHSRYWNWASSACALVDLGHRPTG